MNGAFGVSRSISNLLARLLSQPALLAACIVVTLAVLPASAQQLAGAENRKPIDATTQGATIDSVAKALNETYIFPDKARDMEKFIRKQFKSNAYKDLTDPMAFTMKLTEDLRSITHDLHLGVRWYPADAPDLIEHDSMTTAERKSFEDELAFNNYGFEKLERMPGNVGYVKFDNFIGAELAAPTAIAAMNFLAHCSPIIVDLRTNGGGDPSMIQLLSSYFFDTPVHLNSFYVRQSDSIQQFWTSASVSGPRMTNTDLYVLTSGRTFSAAEEFTYNLKNLKRATIVGETTGGGAHPVNDHIFRSLQVVASVPYGRAINPITGTNWEGTGVKPDIDVPADKALEVAYSDALRKALDKAATPEQKQQLTWLMEGRDATAKPFQLDPATMPQYVGSFGPRNITLESGSLYYQRKDRPKFRLIPMAADKFMLEGLDAFRIKFTRDASGQVSNMIGMYDNGMTDLNPKNK
jgi:retinol-binding protein 3